jgi:prophage regulatory protein
MPSRTKMAMPPPLAATLPVYPPSTGFLRLTSIIGDEGADPPIPPIIPVCKSTWWQGVKEGRFPPAIKLSPRVTVWRAADIFALVAQPTANPK